MWTKALSHPLERGWPESNQPEGSQSRDVSRRMRPRAAGVIEPRFIHDGLHTMNVMCSSCGELLAIIDWGDAGCGDPALDFAAVPFDDRQSALAGYEAEAPALLGRDPEARIAWINSSGFLRDSGRLQRAALPQGQAGRALRGGRRSIGTQDLDRVDLRGTAGRHEAGDDRDAKQETHRA